MINEHTSIVEWSFPFCPTPPAWTLDWDSIQAQFSWIRAMDGVQQSPIFHAEGDVLIHTRRVVEALIGSDEWRNLPAQERMLLFASALLHDTGKPVCTKFDEFGRITSRGHAQKGEFMARQFLWTGQELPAPLPFLPREYIARMVRFHGLPLQFLFRARPERPVIAASQTVRMRHLALLAEADVRGRICRDRDDLLERIALFRELCKTQRCYEQPRQFSDEHTRFMYFHKERTDPNDKADNDTSFEVVLMSGLPAVGKDTWVCSHYAGRPIVALDAMRRRLKVPVDEEQGHIVYAAREQARELLRKKESFIWNATNVTRITRQHLVDLFVSYGAHVRIVYLDTPFDILLKRNSNRPESVPEQMIYKLLGKLEVPDVTEAHTVEWIYT